MKTVCTAISIFVLMLTTAVAQRLPETARPENYKLKFAPDLENAKFEGDETISVRVLRPTSEITLNAVDIDFHNVTISRGSSTQQAKVTAQKDNEMVTLAVEKPLPPGSAVGIPSPEDLPQAYAELQQRFQRTTNALGSAAHDLKTPLAIMNGYV